MMRLMYGSCVFVALYALSVYALSTEMDAGDFGEGGQVVRGLSTLCARLNGYGESDFDENWQNVFETLTENSCVQLREEVGDQGITEAGADFEPELDFFRICNKMDRMGLIRPEDLSENVYDVLLDVGELCESARELLDDEAAEVGDDDDEYEGSDDVDVDVDAVLDFEEGLDENEPFNLDEEEDY